MDKEKAEAKTDNVQTSVQSPSTYSETGSKSGSSKSDEETKTEPKDQDLTKDNAATPIDLECHIQAERITKILDETIYKTKVCLCLHELVREYRILKAMLTPQHFDDLVFIFEQYDNPLFSTSLLNMAAMEDIKAGDISLRNRLNPELGHLLYIMNSYKELRPIVEAMIAKQKADYLKQGERREIIPSMEYLLLFEQFRELMIKQMATTAAEELALKFLTRKLEAANEKHLQKIQEYTTAIRAENETFEKAMAGKAALISKLEQELNVLNQAAAIKLKKKVLDSDRQMVMMSRKHNVRNEMLREEETEIREGYESTLHTHLIEEKAQRMRRFKVETQLLSWLQKYDTEMSDKQVFYDDLDEKYEHEKELVEKLTADIEEQDKEYIPLMEERAKEYHEEMTAKMKEFLMDHAARVIQTCWRQVIANRVEKRKLRAIWKKIKEARERAEKIQERKEAAERKAQAALEAKKKKKKEKD